MELFIEEPVLPDDMLALERSIADREIQEGPVKSDNEARIVWHNPEKTKTEYSVVYLHGFSASQGEGDPVHRKFASAIGANLYLSRLYAHGIGPDAFRYLTPENYLNSAARAVSIGKKIGEKCIVMGTSAGGMLSLHLAARDPSIHALYLYSPLIDFVREELALLEYRAFNKVANVFLKKLRLRDKGKSKQQILKYWYSKYHFQGVLALYDLAKALKPETHFKKITQPFFMGYYYKSDLLQDPTVSVKAMKNMYRDISTPALLKKAVAYPHAESHVITSKYTSPIYTDVLQDSLEFFEKTIALPIG